MAAALLEMAPGKTPKSVTVYDCAPARGTRTKAIAAHTPNLIPLIVQSSLEPIRGPLVRGGQKGTVVLTVDLSIRHDLPRLINPSARNEYPPRIRWNQVVKILSMLR